MKQGAFVELYNPPSREDFRPDVPFDQAHPPRFDGATYEKDKDEARLTGQALRVFDAMKDGKWRTLSWIARTCVCTEASASARLRDFRKKRFGLHDVDRQRRLDYSGVFEYRLIVNRRLL